MWRPWFIVDVISMQDLRWLASIRDWRYLALIVWVSLFDGFVLRHVGRALSRLLIDDLVSSTMDLANKELRAGGS